MPARLCHVHPSSGNQMIDFACVLFQKSVHSVGFNSVGALPRLDVALIMDEPPLVGISHMFRCSECRNGLAFNGKGLALDSIEGALSLSGGDLRVLII